MLWNLLTDAADAGANAGDAGAGAATQAWWQPYVMPAMMVLIIAAAVIFFILNRRSQKKRAKEMQGMLDAIQPGNKVKTIGGICGIVVEVCPEDNTFVLETGTEASGKSYIKFDKQAVYQTDAAPKKEEPKKEAKKVVEEQPVEVVAEPATETVEAPVEEAAKEETPKKKSKKKNK